MKGLAADAACCLLPLELHAGSIPVFSVGAEAGVTVSATLLNRVANHSVGVRTTGRFVARYHFR